MKVVVGRLPLVSFNVLLNLVLGDCTDCRAEIAACPQMPSPVAFLQMRELFLQLAGRDAFDVLDYFGWRQSGRTRHQHMNVIDTDMTLDYFDVTAHTHLL